jgi:hypothetical protein
VRSVLSFEPFCGLVDRMQREKKEMRVLGLLDKIRFFL